MDPSGRRKATRKPRGPHHKKRLNGRSKNEEKQAKSSTMITNVSDDKYLSTISSIQVNVVDVTCSSSGGCSTPKGSRFQIPRISTCPPAPKKRRVLSNCSMKRTPIAFFAPPDLELFFFCALRDILV